MEFTHVSSDGLTSTAFGSSFGALPHVSRKIAHKIDDATGRVMGTVHTITVEGLIVAAGATTDLRQADITTKLALLEALGQSGSCYWSENDAGVAWAYNDATKANDHVCRFGLKIVDRDIPYGPAQHVTNAPYTIVFSAEVVTCGNDPIANVASLAYTFTEEWDATGLVSITITGNFCACGTGDTDGSGVLDNLRDNVFTPEARERYEETGHVLGAGFGPSKQTRTRLDPDGICWGFTFVYGGGQFPEREASSIKASATVTIEQNTTRVQVRATYEYRGNPQTAGSLPFGGFNPLPPFPGAGGNSYDAVYAEAARFDGIDPKWFFPPGGGSVIHVIVDPTFEINAEAHTITATRTYVLNWIHGTDILYYSEQVTINGTLPGQTFHRLAPMPNVPTPLPYKQGGSVGEITITYQIELRSCIGYREIPERLAAAIGLWRVEPVTMAAHSLEPWQSPGAGLSRSGGRANVYVTTDTQTFKALALSVVPALAAVPVGHVQQIGLTVTPQVSGTRGDGGFGL
ncbi:MAG TPA: hypothetical protein DCQ64_15880 [Candidatus Rokubacteria bacterium]|nr:hypothetical protein [Candidatus Rokubacteria bacterium]